MPTIVGDADETGPGLYLQYAPCFATSYIATPSYKASKGRCMEYDDACFIRENVREYLTSSRQERLNMLRKLAEVGGAWDYVYSGRSPSGKITPKEIRFCTLTSRWP